MSEKPAPGGLVITAAVTVGILVAALVLWIVVSAHSSGSEYDCVMDNADRALAEQPAKAC